MSNGTGLDFQLVRQLASRPPLFAPHDGPFWNDPHIAQQMLAAHLDPNRDAASRRPETIDRTVDWLVNHLQLGTGCRVLDLGCGPGLYCERLVRRGLDVVGIDFSEGSIAYARNSARHQNLDVEYVYQDYTRLDRVSEFDAVFLIYYDFGVLSTTDRDEVLRRVHQALKPGGYFAFDVLTTHSATEPDGATTWSISPGGFWKPGPYLELTQHFHYSGDRVKVRQTVIVEENGRVSRYRIWEQVYVPDTVAAVLAQQGFVLESVWNDLAGQPFEAGSPGLGVVTRRQ
jgi:SAM-dependent methyltransferase